MIETILAAVLTFGPIVLMVIGLLWLIRKLKG